MSKTVQVKPAAIALGAVMITSLSASGVVNAQSNPFAVHELPVGERLAASHMEGRCGEGKCGEGKCGDMTKGRHTHPGGKSPDEGKCGEGKCGEGKCGAADKGEHIHSKDL